MKKILQTGGWSSSLIIALEDKRNGQCILYWSCAGRMSFYKGGLCFISPSGVQHPSSMILEKLRLPVILYPGYFEKIVTVALGRTRKSREANLPNRHCPAGFTKVFQQKAWWQNISLIQRLYPMQTRLRQWSLVQKAPVNCGFVLITAGSTPAPP